jgi:hypothetical protein
MGRPANINFQRTICVVCEQASKELSAAYRAMSMLRGEAALDAVDRDIDLFESILEDHPNHEHTVEDSFIATIGAGAIEV